MSDKGSNDVFTTTSSNIHGYSQDFDSKMKSRAWNKSSASKKIAKAYNYSGPSDVLAPGLTSTLPGYLGHSYHEPIKKEGIFQKKHSRSDNCLTVNTTFYGGGLRTVTGEMGCESERSSALMKSGRVFQDRSYRSFTSYVQRQQSGRNMSIFRDKNELTQVRGAHHAGPSGDVAASAVNCELKQENFGRNIDIQESFSNHCCFVGHNIESCPCEENSLAKQRWPGVFQGLRTGKNDRAYKKCMPSGMGLAFGKRLSRSCFKNFSCISSADVFPSIRNCLTCGPSRHRTKKYNAGEAEVCRQDSTRECVAAEGVFCADLGVAPRVKWLSFMHRASIKPDILISESGLSNESSVYEQNDNNENLQDLHESSSNTDEDISALPSMSLCGESHTNQCGGMEEDRSELEYEMSSSPALDGLSGLTGSTLNFTRPLSPSPFRTPRHRRNLEVMSSPLYMSSPEVLFSDSNLPCSYSSSSLRSATLPENHGHHTRTAEAQVFRPLRQLPFRGFELNPLCVSLGGYSESSSNLEHAETEDLSYELFIWEANMFLNGIAYHDQYRDMRLDVDNMTYEELLSLEESIGIVSTGLDKAEISRRLKCTRYLSADMALLSSGGDIEVKCSICQEELVEGVELGCLECGHSYHIPCIEQWLLQKNQCPICKASTS